MKILNHISQKLRAPYPSYQQFNLFDLTLKVGVITFFILIINLASGIESEDLLLVFGFSLGMFLVLLFNLTIIPRLLPQIFSENDWVVWKQIVWILFQFFSIATLNFIFFVVVGVSYFAVDIYLNFVGTTVALGIAPVVAIVLYEENNRLKKNLNEAQTLTRQLDHKKSGEVSSQAFISIQSSLANQGFRVKQSDVLFIEAADNYVMVYFFKNDAVHTEMIRNTLKAVQQQLVDCPEFFRCHRAYLVNINQVTQVQGNAQGLKLTVNEYQIPVSRSFVQSFKNIFEQRSLFN